MRKKLRAKLAAERKRVDDLKARLEASEAALRDVGGAAGLRLRLHDRARQYDADRARLGAGLMRMFHRIDAMCGQQSRGAKGRAAHLRAAATTRSH